MIGIPLRSCCGHTFTADDVGNDDNDAALSRAKDFIVGKCEMMMLLQVMGNHVYFARVFARVRTVFMN